MSELNRLIQELCPEGVPYRALGEVGTFTRGNGFQKSDFVDSGVGCIHYGQIHTYYRTSTDRTISFVSESVAQRSKKAHPGDVIVAITSEDVDAVCKAVAWLGQYEIAVSGHTCILHHNENPRYIAYCFQTKDFASQKRRYAKGTKVVEMKPDNVAKIKIPVPPLPVQAKIVEILDKFTQLEAELEAQLEAELEARRKQYEYYRNELLSFDNLVKRGGVVRLMALGEIGGYQRTRISASELNEEIYVGVENLLQDKQGKVNSSCVPATGNFIRYQKNDVLIGNIRPYLKKIWLATNDGGTNGDVLAFHLSDDFQSQFNPRFLYYQLSSDKFFDYDTQRSRGAKMPRGDKEAILQYKIPVPPLAVQSEIVAILDKFDALTNDLSQGLPAELAMRRAQYEYYRDKLLTFSEKESA
ncbi:MAG: restriction endonuclease subunit S [Thermoguttaceae bacterium]|nr:restriction endonuclease subunit S [Thermoguttaceae bacterium]